MTGRRHRIPQRLKINEVSADASCRSKRERAATDAQRRLTEEGMASVIGQSNNTALPWHEFTRLWVRPYVRTQQTASLLLEHYY